MRTPIRLGWSHFAVVASGVGTVLLVVWIAFLPSWEEFYVREFALPRIADRYGFQFGMVQVSRNGRSYMSPGIVSASPREAFERMGIRPGDVPFSYHGNPVVAMYRALMAGERGQVAEFDVVNADDWSSGRDQQAFRTIRVQPHVRAR